MLEVNNVSRIKSYQPISFKADDMKVRKKIPHESTLIQDDFDIIKKEQKKQKLKNNLMLALSATASLAIIGMCGMTMFGKGGLSGLRSKTEQEALKIIPQDLNIIKERPMESYSKEVQEFIKELKSLLTRSDIEDKGGKRIAQVQFIGPGGTGKTDAAAASAKEINKLFPGSEYYVPDLSMLTSSSYKGQDVQMLTEYTNAIRARADALASETKKDGKKRYLIMFLDEFDKIAMQDFSPSSMHDSNKTTGALKTLINTLMEKDNVILMSATNYPELIEGAVSSRLSKRVLFDYLTPKQINAAIIEHYKNSAKEQLISEDLLKPNEKLQQICDIVGEKAHCMEYRKLFKDILPAALAKSPDGGKLELKHMVEALTSEGIVRDLNLTPEEIANLKQIVGI